MDKHSAELARSYLHDYDQLMTPALQERRASVLGHLSTNGQLVEGMREQEANGRRNLAVVRGLVETLPKSGGHFDVDDPFTARQLQANTFWVPFGSGQEYRIPHYIVGERGDASGQYTDPAMPVTNLLVYSAHVSAHSQYAWETEPSVPPLMVVSVWERELDEARRLARQHTGEYSPEELQEMFDPVKGKLVVEEAAGSLSGRHKKGNLDMHFEELSRPFRVKKSIAEVADKGMNMALSRMRVLPDAEMASFDVPTHLNRLAVAFDKVDVLSGLLDKAVEGTVPAPLPQVVEGDVYPIF